MIWDKVQIQTSAGGRVEAQAPVIISASRATDIPAFYADWFFHRLNEGYLKWKNPFNNRPLYISFSKARVIVFWTKNAAPLIKYLDRIGQKIPHYYFQYTLNNYDDIGFEPGLPPLQKRIDTFVELAEKVGSERVIWRFDPLLLTDKMGVDELLRRVEFVGNKLKGYTRKLVFSFADIAMYKKVKVNLETNAIKYHEFDADAMELFACELSRLNENWHLELATCAEQIALEHYGMAHNKCIDDDLMIRLFPEDKILMNFLGVRKPSPNLLDSEAELIKTKGNKDAGQRKFCQCVWSKDIGAYNTCPHFCVYCYANASRQLVMKNRDYFKVHPLGETITD